MRAVRQLGNGGPYCFPKPNVGIRIPLTVLPGLGEGCWHRWVLFVTEHQERVCALCAAVTGSSLRDAGTTSQLGVFSMQAAQSRLIALKWFIRNVFSLIETTKFTSLVEFNKYQWGQNGFKPKGLDAVSPAPSAALLVFIKCWTVVLLALRNCSAGIISGDGIVEMEE